ncbi:dickkopf-related protein 1b [Scyliorhinus canicula]|uniref:Dkk1 n=1 Tax=Scyliorhinus canicula TaxID=7830 RepID=A0A0A0S1S8_SCYCA|nr:dickkopf-related protein 1b [Scyliorhinus canicula]AIW08712.1 Dkk1 [Scyliorhinus canicula]
MYLETVRMCRLFLSFCLYNVVSSFNSNAIKTGSAAVQMPSHPVSIAPQVVHHHSVSKNHAVDQSQFSTCQDDRDCAVEQFCSASRSAAQHCLNCRRRRKRCLRDAMCCPGTRCSNGMCTPNDAEHIHGAVRETSLESWIHEEQETTSDSHPRRTTLSARSHTVKGQEGDICLRSSDCAQGLCCARHFWSKICKPVLREGQVCTRHRRKGSHGLEIFQRCDCAQGFSCRMQRGGSQGSGKNSRLHTCQ